MEQRGGDHLGVAQPERHPFEHGRHPSDRGRIAPPLGALGSTGRAGCQDDDASLDPLRCRRASCRGEAGQRRLVDRLAAAPCRDLGELEVVDHMGDPLVFDHVRELRSGEARVEQHEVGPGRGHGDERLHEAPMVPAQQADPRSLADTRPAQPVGDRLSATPQLGIRGRTVFVVDRHPIRVPGGCGGHDPGERCAPRHDGEHRPGQAVGPLEQRQIRPRDDGSSVQLTTQGHRRRLYCGCLGRHRG